MEITYVNHKKFTLTREHMTGVSNSYLLLSIQFFDQSVHDLVEKL
jgi:hypothetical protein